MAIRSFRVGPIPGLREAAASELPNLVVLAGPNGAGKSTLLHALHSTTEFREPGTRVEYLGPHRAWRRATLTMSGISELPRSLGQFLEASSVPRWDRFQPRGLEYVAAGAARDHRAHDEAFSFVKSSVVNLDARLRDLLRRVWERQHHEIRRGDVPDLLAPLRDVVRALLPHLELREVDASDERDVRVLFRRVDGHADDLVEIDDLSSGEKSVVGLMLPIVEAEIDDLLLKNAAGGDGPLMTLIIDEPETHLHPTLQVLLIEHLAELAAADRSQFIVATQSPTIVDALDDRSLFLVAPAAVRPNGNQLLPLGAAQPKLELMRTLTGSTHLLTRCRPVVFLEGERPSARPISDQRLAELLMPAAKGWVLVAAGGRGEAARAAASLRSAADEALPGVPVFALVDADQAQHIDADFVIRWPVTMIENLLLDSQAIWQVLEPHRDCSGLRGPSDVEAALRGIAQSLAPDEVRLRVATLQTPICIRLSASSEDEVEHAIAEAQAAFTQKMSHARSALPDELRQARRAVAEIQRDGRELEAFRGKEILKRFHERYMHRAGHSYKAFAYAVAREAAGRDRVTQMTTEACRRIEQFVPAELISALNRTAELDEDTAKTLLQRATAARAQWERAEPVDEDLEDLRRAIVDLATRLPSEPAVAAALSKAVAHLGTRSAVAS